MGPNGFVSNQPNVAIKYTNTNQAGQYIVTATGKCNALKDTVSFIAPMSPSVHLGNDTSICEGASVHLKATTSGTNVDYTWNTGAKTDTITVYNVGLYSVTISKNGCTTSDTIHIGLMPKPSPIYLGSDTAFCGNFTYLLNTGNANTIWSTGATSPQITVNKAGMYFASISNLCGIASDSILIQQKTIPSVYIKNDTTLCDGASVLLEVLTDATSVLWSTGDTSRIVFVDEAGIYWTRVRKDGCNAVDSVEVAACPGEIAIPNAFSPNNDQINDYFQVYGKNILTYKIKIYNRWGEEVFVSDNLQYSWDGIYKGAPAPLDSYAWIVFYSISENGTTREKMKKGTLTLLR